MRRGWSKLFRAPATHHMLNVKVGEKTGWPVVDYSKEQDKQEKGKEDGATTDR